MVIAIASQRLGPKPAKCRRIIETEFAHKGSLNDYGERIVKRSSACRNDSHLVSLSRGQKDGMENSTTVTDEFMM